jgi:undecaprenyl-diphosphatase
MNYNHKHAGNNEIVVSLAAGGILVDLKSLFTRSFMISLFCGLAFAIIAILIGRHNIASFDNAIISWIRGWNSDTMTAVMKFFTFIGAGYPIIVITAFFAALLYFGLKFRWELLFFLGVVIGSALLNVVLKLIFHRARPTVNRIVEAGGFSYPSGHAMAAFTLYGVLTYLLWRHAPNAYTRVLLICTGSLMILAIGISRIYLGVHYPSDIIGGYLASSAWLASCVGFNERFRDRRAVRSPLRNF